MTETTSQTSSSLSNHHTRPSHNIPSPWNQQQYLQFADASLETQSQLAENIQINIDSHETRNAFINYVVYHIVGRDKNGPIDVYRRFNEFYKMREAIIKRFPGCFIPSIPEKSISLVDDEIVNKRQRYLNDFVRRMAKLPHLYNSEEFQALLRSAEKDLSGTFEKWPNPTTTDIINKYKENFSHLAGKVIDSTVKQNIANFKKIIVRTSVYMYRFKIQIKQLAMIRNKFDKSLIPFFTRCLPSLERQCISECVRSDKELIYTSQSQKIEEIQKKMVHSLKKNPYWLLYDLVKREQRDGIAFLECTKAIQEYQRKSNSIQIKMAQNNRSIAEFSMGKKSNSQLKYKLQVQNESLKREKEAIQCLTDIITAIVVYVEMNKFKSQKRAFYLTVMKKLGGYECSQLRTMHQMWHDLNVKSSTTMNKQFGV